MKTLLQTSAGYQPRTTNNAGEDPMPLPTPHAHETRDDFVARCMKDPATQDITGDSPENTQARRVAACERQFGAAKQAEPDAAQMGMKALGALELGDEATGDVSAIVATLGEIDHDGEIIAPDAIPDGMKVIMSSYNHNSVMGQMLGTGIPDQPPVGKGVIRITGNKAVYQGRYFMETERGREAYLTTKAMGPDAKWSFAYGITKTAKPSSELQAKGARRVLEKLGSLPGNAGMEVSPVNMPGGVGTGTLSLKAKADEAESTEETASVDGTEHPASDFAYVPDEEKPSTWKFPIFDAAHVRNALARFDQADIPDAAKAGVLARIHEAARKFGIDVAAERKAVQAQADLDAAVALRLRRFRGH